MKLMRKCVEPTMRHLSFAATVRICRYPSETIGTMSLNDIQVTGQDRSVIDSFFARFCGENHDLAESREDFMFRLGLMKKDSAVNSGGVQVTS